MQERRVVANAESEIRPKRFLLPISIYTTSYPTNLAIETLTLLLHVYIVRTLVGDSRICASEDDGPRTLDVVTEGGVGLPARAVGAPELSRWEGRGRWRVAS